MRTEQVGPTGQNPLHVVPQQTIFRFDQLYASSQWCTIKAERHSYSGEVMNQEQIEDVIHIVSTLVGLAVGAALFLGFEWDLGQASERVDLITFCVAPVLLMVVMATFLKRRIEELQVKKPYWSWVKIALVYFCSGIEAAYFLAAWFLLKLWLSEPETTYIEPMFVSIGVALGVLDYCRRAIIRMQ
jgi:hypothetical protein